MVDLGMAPPCESFLRADQVEQVEFFYPLKVMVCTTCWLVQLDEYVAPEGIFTDYVYFSSFSTSWLDHTRRYAEKMIEDFNLDGSSRVLELASNDGYLLRWFVERGIPSLGVEPAANVAEVAVAAGIPTIVEFFTADLARRMVADGYRADLIAANNVLAQVPPLHDFLEGISIVLADTGVTTIEVPHLARLIEERQFDTIYHEHYSYFSLGTVAEMVRRHGLEVFDVEELPTHGGSLRIYLHHASDGSHPPTDRVEAMLAYEDSKGLRTKAPYVAFGEAVKNLKWDLMELLIDLKRQGKEVVGYGAAGKGNTLLNYCGIRTDFLTYIADRNHHKHGLFTPGTHIPVVAPEMIDQTTPDVVMILPWNLKDEIMRQLSAHQERGGQFLIPIPDPVLIGGDR